MSALREVAERYAGALFQLADEAKALDTVAEDLAQLKAEIGASADLRRLLSSPVISREDQGRAMAELIKRAGASTLVGRFVGLIARNRRLNALGSMIDAFQRMLSTRRGEVVAEVASARPLSAEQKNALTEALRKAVGAKVAVDLRIDESLIGGLVVKVGSRMVDSSLKTKLARLQLAMKGIG